MSDPYLGEVRLFAFNFVPINWAQCNGQLLSIAGHAALFTILGTAYGGDGKTNFALPNLQGRVPLGEGQGTGLSLYSLGQTGGVTSVTLTQQQVPAHRHGLQALTSTGSTNVPSGGVGLAEGNAGSRGSTHAIRTYTSKALNTPLNGLAVGTLGNNQPHTNMQASLVMNWCISLSGQYPPRS